MNDLYDTRYAIFREYISNGHKCTIIQFNKTTCKQNKKHIDLMKIFMNNYSEDEDGITFFLKTEVTQSE